MIMHFFSERRSLQEQLAAADIELKKFEEHYALYQTLKATEETELTVPPTFTYITPTPDCIHNITKLFEGLLQLDSLVHKALKTQLDASHAAATHWEFVQRSNEDNIYQLFLLLTSYKQINPRHYARQVPERIRTASTLLEQAITPSTNKKAHITIEMLVTRINIFKQMESEALRSEYSKLPSFREMTLHLAVLEENIAELLQAQMRQPSHRAITIKLKRSYEETDFYNQITEFPEAITHCKDEIPRLEPIFLLSHYILLAIQKTLPTDTDLCAAHFNNEIARWLKRISGVIYKFGTSDKIELNRSDLNQATQFKLLQTSFYHQTKKSEAEYTLPFDIATLTIELYDFTVMLLKENKERDGLNFLKILIQYVYIELQDVIHAMRLKIYLEDTENKSVKTRRVIHSSRGNKFLKPISKFHATVQRRLDILPTTDELAREKHRHSSMAVFYELIHHYHSNQKAPALSALRRIEEEVRVFSGAPSEPPLDEIITALLPFMQSVLACKFSLSEYPKSSSDLSLRLNKVKDSVETFEFGNLPESAIEHFAMLFACLKFSTTIDACPIMVLFAYITEVHFYHYMRSEFYISREPDTAEHADCAESVSLSPS